MIATGQEDHLQTKPSEERLLKRYDDKKLNIDKYYFLEKLDITFFLKKS